MKHSFLKYTGSKRFVAAELAARFPKHDRFVDLTVGGGSILLHSEKPKLISDINLHVINAYKLVKNNPQYLINHYKENHALVLKDNTHYYTVRNRYNKSNTPEDFIFLTRTCYNGVIRFNRKGEFNTAFHVQGRNGMTPAKLEPIIMFWHQFLQNVEIKCGDYAEVYQPQDGDFIFLDPPYLATKGQYLSEASNFNFERLNQFLQMIDKCGIKFMCCLDNNIGTNFLPFESFTTKKYGSSLSRLKGKVSNVGDTIFTNV